MKQQSDIFDPEKLLWFFGQKEKPESIKLAYKDLSIIIFTLEKQFLQSNFI